MSSPYIEITTFRMLRIPPAGPMQKMPLQLLFTLALLFSVEKSLLREAEPLATSKLADNFTYLCEVNSPNPPSNQAFSRNSPENFTHLHSVIFCNFRSKNSVGSTDPTENFIHVYRAQQANYQSKSFHYPLKVAGTLKYLPKVNGFNSQSKDVHFSSDWIGNFPHGWKVLDYNPQSKVIGQHFKNLILPIVLPTTLKFISLPPPVLGSKFLSLGHKVLQSIDLSVLFDRTKDFEAKSFYCQDFILHSWYVKVPFIQYFVIEWIQSPYQSMSVYRRYRESCHIIPEVHLNKTPYTLLVGVSSHPSSILLGWKFNSKLTSKRECIDFFSDFFLSHIRTPLCIHLHNQNIILWYFSFIMTSTSASQDTLGIFSHLKVKKISQPLICLYIFRNGNELKTEALIAIHNVWPLPAIVVLKSKAKLNVKLVSEKDLLGQLVKWLNATSNPFTCNGIRWPGILSPPICRHGHDLIFSPVRNKKNAEFMNGLPTVFEVTIDEVCKIIDQVVILLTKIVVTLMSHSLDPSIILIGSPIRSPGFYPFFRPMRCQDLDERDPAVESGRPPHRVRWMDQDGVVTALSAAFALSTLRHYTQDEWEEQDLMRITGWTVWTSSEASAAAQAVTEPENFSKKET